MSMTPQELREVAYGNERVVSLAAGDLRGAEISLANLAVYTGTAADTAFLDARRALSEAQATLAEAAADILKGAESI